MKEDLEGRQTRDLGSEFEAEPVGGPVGPDGTKAVAREAGPLILLAEDNATNRMIMLKLIEKLGWRAGVANDGREAVDAARRRRYELVLMDCQMPELDGFEATRQIRLWEEERRKGGGIRSRGRLHSTIRCRRSIAPHSSSP